MSSELAELPTTPVVRFVVLGTPAPKGSGRAMLIGGRARFVAGGSSANAAAMRSWDTAVRDSAWLERSEHHRAVSVNTPLFVDQPLAVSITFRMRRPGGHWGKRGLKPSAPRFPATKPDVDKLVRATLDSMSGVIFDDDSRIVSLRAWKVWADAEQEGASVVVEVA